MSTKPSTSDGSIADSLAEFVDVVADALDDAGVDESVVDDVADQGDDLVDDVADVEDRLNDLEDQPTIEVDDRDPIGSLRVDGAPVGRAIKSKPGESDLEARLDDLRADLEAANPTPDADKSASTDLYQPETPIEQVVAMPEEMATDQLTANQDRARFVATDVRDYAESVPAGWAISSTDLRRVLQAYDDSGHTETVARVFDILNDLGGDEIRIVDRHGTRRIVFTDDLVARLDRLDQESHDVVIEGTA